MTWRLASRYGDELNLDGKTPEAVAKDLPVIASRCEEVDRDPDDLPVSVHVFTQIFGRGGSERVEMLGRYAELGVSRVIGLVQDSANDDEALDSLAADCREAKVEMAD